MNRVVVYRGAVPTSRAEVHECLTAVQRLLSLHVTNTTDANIGFTLDVDRGGTTTTVLDAIPVYGSSAQHDVFEWVPARFLLTRSEAASSGLGLVGDIIGITATGAGLEYHLAVEFLEDE